MQLFPSPKNHIMQGHGVDALEVVKQEFYLSRQPFFHVDTKNLKSVDFSYKTLVLQLLRHLVYNYLEGLA